MSRGRMSERLVERYAIQQLRECYEARPEVRKVCGIRQAWVKRGAKLGRGRADGLVAARRQDNTLHVASIEAKSSKLKLEVRPKYRSGSWVIHGAGVGMTGLGLTGYVGWQMEGWLWHWLVPVIAFFVFSLVYMALLESRYRPIPIVQQVMRYPANDRWLALPSDLYYRLKQEELDALHADCDRLGVGLLRVSPGGKASVEKSPKSCPCPEGVPDFLTCYMSEQAIRQELVHD